MREKKLRKQQGPIVSLVVAGITQLTLLTQVKLPTLERCSECGIGCVQVSVITLAHNYLT